MRHFDRRPAEVLVLVRVVGHPGADGIHLNSSNLSEGGAFLRSDLLFEVGEMLVMEFDLPGGRHIRTQGRVVRVARGGAKDKFPGMGLEFIDLSPDDRAAIARLT